MILNQDNEYVVVLDACVIVPMPVCDTLLRLASDPAMYQVRWSAMILGEAERALRRRGIADAQVNRRMETMRQHFPEAMMTGFECLQTAWELPDPGDWHVMAAAIVCRANAIVTANLRHFPEDKLRDVGILIQHPDDFLLHQLHLNRSRVKETLAEQASACRNSIPWLVGLLERGHPKFAAALRKDGFLPFD
ncbi:MAG: PIN domain-containing protein [Bryobacterales bacterium]|nr:PIN domain-containing protein [Bryobacterales bacterium]